jgi:hypothetical protein
MTENLPEPLTFMGAAAGAVLTEAHPMAETGPFENE